MDDNDKQQFAATVQAFMSLLLIGAVALVVILILGLIGYLQIRKLPVDQGMMALLNTGYNALINMGAIGVGFWLARHRPQNGSDDQNVIDPLAPKPPEKKP